MAYCPGSAFRPVGLAMSMFWLESSAPFGSMISRRLGVYPLGAVKVTTTGVTVSFWGLHLVVEGRTSNPASFCLMPSRKTSPPPPYCGWTPPGPTRPDVEPVGPSAQTWRLGSRATPQAAVPPLPAITVDQMVSPAVAESFVTNAANGLSGVVNGSFVGKSGDAVCPTT